MTRIRFNSVQNVLESFTDPLVLILIAAEDISDYGFRRVFSALQNIVYFVLIGAEFYTFTRKCGHVSGLSQKYEITIQLLLYFYQFGIVILLLNASISIQYYTMH